MFPFRKVTQNGAFESEAFGVLLHIFIHQEKSFVN
jgi:hypothetical protein